MCAHVEIHAFGKHISNEELAGQSFLVCLFVCFSMLSPIPLSLWTLFSSHPLCPASNLTESLHTCGQVRKYRQGRSLIIVVWQTVVGSRAGHPLFCPLAQSAKLVGLLLALFGDFIYTWIAIHISLWGRWICVSCEFCGLHVSFHVWAHQGKGLFPPLPESDPPIKVFCWEVWAGSLYFWGRALVKTGRLPWMLLSLDHRKCGFFLTNLVCTRWK